MKLIVVPQSLYEFWAVATRPSGPPPAGRNGLGMTAVQAGHWLRFFRRRFMLLPDREELSTLWQELVERHVVMGVRAHDVRVVAGWTLIKLLAGIFVITATMAAWGSVAARHGTWWGVGAVFSAGSLSC